MFWCVVFVTGLMGSLWSSSVGWFWNSYLSWRVALGCLLLLKLDVVKWMIL